MNFHSFTMAAPCPLLSKRILMVLKIVTFLMLVTLMHVSASSFSQAISLNEKDTPVEKVLERISKQSGFHFFYDAATFANYKVTISIRDAQIEKALDSCLRGLPVTYKIMGKNVVLVSAEKNNSIPSQPQQARIVKGTVFDEDMKLLIGVTIRNRNSGKGTVTDSKGGYVIAADIGDVLVISFVAPITLPALNRLTSHSWYNCWYRQKKTINRRS